jgi:hypothetical protein
MEKVADLQDFLKISILFLIKISLNEEHFPFSQRP